jgi:hypothetical protein
MEKEKKFKNLSEQYRNYLNEIDGILRNFNITITYPFNILNDYYTQINIINDRRLILEKDIEHLIKNYEKTNLTIQKLKCLLRKRNKEIVRNLLTSDIYKEYLNKLHAETKKSISNIDAIFMEIIKKYAMNWKCCWSFVEFDSNGITKKVELFDVNDIKYLRESLGVKT